MLIVGDRALDDDEGRCWRISLKRLRGVKGLGSDVGFDAKIKLEVTCFKRGRSLLPVPMARKSIESC